jgi:hypothetical protein
LAIQSNPVNKKARSIWRAVVESAAMKVGSYAYFIIVWWLVPPPLSLLLILIGGCWNRSLCDGGATPCADIGSELVIQVTDGVRYVSIVDRNVQALRELGQVIRGEQFSDPLSGPAVNVSDQLPAAEADAGRNTRAMLSTTKRAG